MWASEQVSKRVYVCAQVQWLKRLVKRENGSRTSTSTKQNEQHTIRLTPSCGNFSTPNAHVCVCDRSLWTFANYVHLLHSIELDCVCWQSVRIIYTTIHSLRFAPKQWTTSKKWEIIAKQIWLQAGKMKTKPTKSECITCIRAVKRTFHWT